VKKEIKFQRDDKLTKAVIKGASPSIPCLHYICTVEWSPNVITGSKDTITVTVATGLPKGTAAVQ
jgi:hypothetical protein